jgi:hypothetical protein
MSRFDYCYAECRYAECRYAIQAAGLTWYIKIMVKVSESNTLAYYVQLMQIF